MAGFFPGVSGRNWVKLACLSHWKMSSCDLAWKLGSHVFMAQLQTRMGRDEHQLLKSSLPCSENQDKVQSSVSGGGVNLRLTPWEKPEDHLQVPARPKKSLPTQHRLGCVCFSGPDRSQGPKALCGYALSEAELMHHGLALESCGIFSFR